LAATGTARIPQVFWIIQNGIWSNAFNPPQLYNKKNTTDAIIDGVKKNLPKQIDVFLIYIKI
jgi:hypothetical protein